MGRRSQPPMPASAQRAGLEVLRRVLRRRNPGFDVTFEVVGADHVDDPPPGKVGGGLAAPEDSDSAVDGVNVPSATTGAPDDQAVEETAQDLPAVGNGQV